MRTNLTLLPILASYCLYAVYGSAQETAATSEVKVWAVPAEQKVLPEHKAEKKNLVWSEPDKMISVAGAGNEHVAFQVVISAPVPPGWRPKAPDGFFITASDLTSPQGKTIPQKQVNLYLEHYILIYAVSSPVGKTGYWPDALAPIREPFGMAVQYAVTGNRPIWVDVAIPAGTPKGIYTGKIRLPGLEKPWKPLMSRLRFMASPCPTKRI